MSNLIVVGIGASAGGLFPLQTLFENLSKEISGCAFIVVQHFDPTQPSLLPELLSKHTQLTVSLAQDQTPIKADHIYVIEPNTILTVKNDVLQVSRISRPRGIGSGIIDELFFSLASQYKESSIGIILSGMGTDGTLGAQSIQTEGGLVIAQDPNTAHEPGLPQSLIDSESADLILPPNEIPKVLFHQSVQQTSESYPTNLLTAHGFLEDQISAIWPLLTQRTGHDFSGHRQNSVLRRIARRMQILNIKNLSEYIAHLRSHSNEIDALYRDLLIGVTEFFRDPDHFARLEQDIIPRLFQGKPREDHPIRVWIPGCASGEEAYSIAILLLEYQYRKRTNCNIQVFATDLRDEALEIARRGIYPLSISESISEERLEHYFEQKNGHFRVNRELRESCIFSRHDLIRDPPFSRLDLISCRNLLIYLEPELQKKVLSLFHYGLKSEGFLFLGPSESISLTPELFRPIDSLHRIFQSKEALWVRPSLIRSQSDFERNQVFHAPSPRKAIIESPPVQKLFKNTLLSEYATPAVLVDANDNIVCTSGKVSRFLELPAGALDVHIVNMATKTLRADLRALLFRARHSKEPVKQQGVVADLGIQIQKIDLIARRFTEIGPDSEFLLVLFRPIQEPETKQGQIEQEIHDDVKDAIHRHLEQELRETKERLQSTIEELEASNEEMKSSNEELQSMNEELQSSNEELQTSKEELQSLNEELETVNNELKSKIRELDMTYSDLENLFESTHIATILLDKDFRIKRYTPAATDIFHLISSDIGRKLSDIRPKIGEIDILTEARRVIQTLNRIEIPIRSAQTARQYVLRIHPYKTLSNIIDGTVITFVDVTELKTAQEQTLRLAAIVEGSGDAIVSTNLDRLITSWNLGAERLYGHKAIEVIGKSISILIPPEKIEENESPIRKLEFGQRVESFETIHLHQNGGVIHVSLTLSPIFDDNGHIIGISRIARDITARVLAEQALRNSEERYRSLISVLSAVVWTADPSGLFILPQSSWTAYTGQTWQDHKGSGWMKAFHPEDQPRFQDAWTESLNQKSIFRFDGRIWCEKAGQFHHFSMNAVPLFSSSGSIRQWVGSFIDTEERYQNQESILLANQRLETALRASGVMIFNQDRDLRFTWIINPSSELHGQTLLGLTDADYLDQKEEAEDLLRIKRSILETGNTVRSEISLHIQGKIYDFDMVLKPLFGANGQIIGITGAALDISHRKSMERDLRESSRRKDEFLAILGHELRNPLAAIRNATYLLQNSQQTETRRARLHEILERQSNHLSSLIDDLLDVSRIAKGKIDLKSTKINLVQVVQKVFEDFSEELQSSNLNYQYKLPNEPIYVFADPIRIAQIVSNLLSNARKFTSSQDSIHASLRNEKSRVILTIQDTGMGIAPEFIEKIFDPFIQAEQSIDRSQGGLGLGLSLVKGLTEAQSGTVSVQSDGIGKGAIFEVSFPILTQEILSTQKKWIGERKNSEMKGIKILIIEDNLDAAESLKMAIELLGYSVEVAHTGQEGLEIAQKIEPEMIICDIGLPDEMDGFDLARAIRKIPQFGQTYLIALSGYGQEEDKKQAREAGFDLHITKPIDLTQLEKLLLKARD